MLVLAGLAPLLELIFFFLIQVTGSLSHGIECYVCRCQISRFWLVYTNKLSPKAIVIVTVMKCTADWSSSLTYSSISNGISKYEAALSIGIQICMRSP